MPSLFLPLPGRCLRAGLVGLALLVSALVVHAKSDATACPPAATPIGPADAEAARRDDRDRGLLWRIEKDGRTSWLYGTIHAAERGWVLPGPAVREALRRADRIALEVDLMDPAVAGGLATAVMPGPNTPPLPEPLAKRLRVQSEALCADAALARLRPEIQLMSLVGLAARTAGIDPAYGIDLFLAGLARAMDKKVVSLESAEAQIALLVSDDPAKVARTMDEGLRQLEGGQARKIIATLTRAWADGQLETLRNYGDWCDCLKTAEDRADYARIVEGRNPALAAGIAAQHAAGHAVFAAVGVLHMVGPEGLPALMAAQGFRVTRVPPAASGSRQRKPPNAPR
ncbi:TraB/GumN family protein [Acidovorax sp. LjRoot118]|uniref:TraB/GumN family protein n=1 Tax=unclassified Acidovorax TaxID=2684926 RepID=UPI000709ADDE|nr:TraB/GumN family protein [Acidovorax sp. Root217]KRC27784.1 polysaccharide biosynthesis protein GumN [Acidovorax sp. Root217]